MQYYTSCTGQNPAGEDLFNAEYASNMLTYYVNEMATTQCPDNPSLNTALGITEGIADDVQMLKVIADCAPYKEYWETFFNEGMCSDIFDGLYLIWITQTLAVAFLFLVAVIASHMYPYMKLSQNSAPLSDAFDLSSHHQPSDMSHSTTSAISASSVNNPMFLEIEAATKTV